MTIYQARWLVYGAFAAVGIWLAFWHHNDPPTRPIVLFGWLVLGILAAVGAWLRSIIRDRQFK